MNSPKAPNSTPVAERIDLQRRLLADYCRRLGEQLNGTSPVYETATPPLKKPTSLPGPPLSPRLRQTLHLLLNGRGEKEVAIELRISRHTVHGYVKELHRKFGVTSRAELLARWVRADL